MNDLSVRCKSCGSLLDEEDLFCPNCGAEATSEKPAARPAADSSRIAKDNFECKGCGASMSYDAREKALRCPFCGSVDMVQKENRKVLTPKYALPFVVTKDQAVASMRQWLGQGFWRPGKLAAEAAIVGMTPVYVPYWVFSANTHTFWTADTNQTPPGASGDWYPLAGEHKGSYQSVLIGASAALSPGETHALCPFDLNRGVPSEQVDLENITVEEFSLARKYARPLAQDILNSLESETCENAYVPGRGRNMHVNVQVANMAGEPVLLPVWIMAYRFGDRVFRFLVNGQTGQATGQAPLSSAKIVAAILIAILVLVILLILAGGLKAAPAAMLLGGCSEGSSGVMFCLRDSFGRCATRGRSTA
jgi:predicted RNA-binding Zn-ribbon protein involved in translation (DUF1610 family)